jgi:hypothetical protein
MSGERLEAVEVTQQGLLGDRAYALIDAETGKVVSAKSVKLFPGLLDCRAAFVEPPRLGRELPPVRITLPDGKSVTSDSGRAEQELSAHFRREVTLARVSPEHYTIDQYHPDVEGVDPNGRRDTVVEQKLGAAFFKAAGLTSPVPVGAFFDLFPMSVLTTSTLRRLAEIQTRSRFDTRRFRMNLVVETPEAGFVENAWVGRELTVGEDAKLAVAMPDPRCVMTTLAHSDLPQDTEIIRTLTLHNRLEVEGAGRFPCAGVYAVVTGPGQIRIGDPVTVARLPTDPGPIDET